MSPYTETSKILAEELCEALAKLEGHYAVYGKYIPDYERPALAAIIQQMRTAYKFANALRYQLGNADLKAEIVVRSRFTSLPPTEGTFNG